MKITEALSFRIKGLSFLFACLVVPIHCSLIEYGRWFEVGGQHELGIFSAFLSFLFSDTLARVAVPFFFVVSGLFSAKSGSGWYACLLVRRAKTILVPYITWNFIYWVFKCLTGKYSFDWSAWRLILGFSLDGGLACGQFWYVRCLIVYFIALPIFRFVLGNLYAGGFVLSVSLLAWICGGHGYGCHTLGLQNLLAFASGLYFSLHYDTFRSRMNSMFLFFDRGLPSVFLLIVAGQLTFAVLHRPEYYIFQRMVILVGLVAVWGRLGTMLCRIVLLARPLWGMSFFCYAIHVIFVSILIRVIPKEANDAVAYMIRCVGAIALSLALGLTIRNCVPSVFAFLTGGRGDERKIGTRK